MQGDPPPGSQLEQQLAQSLEGFGNLKNLKLLTDDDGNMSYTRVDENGEIVPGESMSVNEMTNLMNQKIDNYDVPAAVISIKEELGTIIKSTIVPKGIRTEITELEMSRAEADYFGSDGGKETLRLKALEMTAVPQNLAVMMTQDVRMPDGELYQGDFGGKKHDAWAEENPDKDQSLNPYIAMRFDGNRYVPDITEEQKEVGNIYAEKIIKTALNISETKSVVKIQETEYQDSSASIEAGRQDEEADASGQSVNILVTGTAVEAEAAAKDLISSFEDLTDIDRVVDADGKVTSFDIKIKGKVVDPISAFDSEGNPKTADQLNRAIFKLVGAKGTYDAWKKRNKVGENVGEGGISSSQAADEIKYSLPSDMVVVGDSKITYDSFFNSESGGNLGSTLAEFGFSDDGEAEVQQGFTNLLDSPSFIPKGLKDFISNDGGKISVKVGESGGAKNNQMVITIGNEVITYDDVYLDESTGGTTGISQKIREAIEKEVKRANTGGGKKTKKKNVG